jgi:hypothetical protein
MVERREGKRPRVPKHSGKFEFESTRNLHTGGQASLTRRNYHSATLPRGLKPHGYPQNIATR